MDHCGNCYYFGNEGINGDGICDLFDKMKICSAEACSEWEENTPPCNIKPSEVF